MSGRGSGSRLWQRLRWDLREQGSLGSREAATIARTFIYLFGAGGTLALLTLPLAHPADFRAAGLVAPALAALTVSGLLAWRLERTPAAVFPWLPAAGTVLASIVIYSAGANDIQVYAGFYFWVALSAVWFFSPRTWALNLAWVAVVYAAVLTASPEAGDAPLRWVGLMGTLAVASIVLAALRERIDRLVCRLGRQLTKQERVAALGRRAVAGAEIGELSELAVRAAEECLEVERAAVYQLIAGEPKLLPKAVSEGAARNGGPPDRSDPMIRALLGPDPLSTLDGAIGAAIPGRAGPYGVLVAADRDRPFTSSDRAFMEAIAHVIGDAIERRRSEDEARHWALHDPLTDRPNRALFRDRLDEALIRGHADDSLIGVFVLDIDHFKRINDSFGHAAADDVLRSFGPRLREALVLADTVARFGGDEFAVLCEGLRNEHDALEIAERIVEALRAPFPIAGASQRIGASIGISLSSESEVADELISQAQAAMYRAKERSRGRFEFFDAEMRERLRRRLSFETALREAPELGQLRLVVQPIVSLPDRRPVGSEALLRWRHPELGHVSPAEFIPVAEETDAIIPVGEWALAEACRLAARFSADERASRLLPLHVNISLRQLANVDFAAQVRRALRESGAAVSDLCLEITEHALLIEEEGTIETLKALRAMGFGIVLDDFGTGYSSLSHLKRFPLDLVKIDRMFVANLTNREEEAIVTSVIAMARAFGLDVVAEGVETRQQAERLAELGCWRAQGFLFSEPVSAEELLSGFELGPDHSASFRPTALNASAVDS